MWKTVARTVGEDVRALSKWDPMNSKVQCALRDTVYMVMDIPRFFYFTNKNYGALRRYLRQQRINKGYVNPEDFKDIDTNVLRESLIRNRQFKGPLHKIDWRIFYWIYLVMFVAVGYQAYTLQKIMDSRQDKTGATLEMRKDMFADDYIEDVRPPRS